MNSTTLVVGIFFAAGLIHILFLAYFIIFLLLQQILTRNVFFVFLISGFVILAISALYFARKMKLGKFFLYGFEVTIAIQLAIYLLAILAVAFRFYFLG